MAYSGSVKENRRFSERFGPFSFDSLAIMGADQRRCFDKIANNETVKGWGCRQFEGGLVFYNGSQEMPEQYLQNLQDA